MILSYLNHPSNEAARKVDIRPHTQVKAHASSPPMANNSCDNLSTHHDENESVINQSGIDDENESATVDKSSEQEEKALSTTLLEIKGPTC